MSSEDEIIRKLTRMTEVLESMTGGFSSATDATRNFTEGMTEAAKSEAESKAIGDAANKRMEKATNEAIKGVASFGKALTSGAEGGFGKLSGGIEATAQSVATLAEGFGRFGKVVAGLTIATGKLLTAHMKQTDEILAASDNIKKLGFAGDQSSKDIFNMAQNAKTSTTKLAEAMKRTQGGLITFGDDFGKGAVKFGEMIKVTDQQREAFQRLGITQEDLMGGQADYIALQKASGHSMSGQLKDTKKLNQASLEYVENLVKLGKLTGKDIDQVKQAQLAAREAYEEKVLVRKEEIEIAALRKKGLNDAADDLLNQQKRRQEFLTLGYAVDKELGAMLAKVIRTEAFDSTTTGLSNVGVEAGKLATDLKNAKTAEEVKELFNRVAETISKGTDRNVQDLNASVQLSGEALGKKLGIFTFVFDKPILEIGQTADKLNDANKKISAAIGNPANPTKPTAGPILDNDPAEISRNFLTTLTLNLTKGLEQLKFDTNPLVKGFDTTTTAVTILAGAAGIASAALVAMAGGKAVIAGGKAIGSLFSKGAPTVPAATTVAAGTTKAAAPAAGSLSGWKAGSTAAAEAGAGAAGEAAKSAAKVAAGEAALKTAGATAGKSMLKALPVVGSILSVASAFGRISSGDYIGAALEGGAAVAALVPGPGTAIALALTGAAGAKDVYTALNPDLAKVPESVPAEPPKSVAQPTAPEVPQQTQVPGEAGRGAAAPPPAPPAAPPAAPAPPPAPPAAPPAAPAPPPAPPAAPAPPPAPPAAPAPASTASRTAGTMGAYKSRGSVVAAKPAVNSATQGSGAPKIEDLFTFGGQTGQRSNFDQLDPAFKTRLVKVAQAYKAEGGTKINVTSALRDQEDQERLYHTWKEAGGDLKTKPNAAGIVTPALPVSMGGRPSAHNVGNAIDAGQQAVDINNKIKLKDFGLIWGGTFKKADPVHIQMGSDLSAAKGGITDGPKSGYPATLHGNEIITPLSPNSILEQLGKTPATTEIAGSSSSSTTNTIKEIYSMNTEVMEMLAGKLDTMISKLSDSNDTQSKLLMYSRV